MEIKNTDFVNSNSSFSAVFESFYPNGEMIVKNTSRSMMPVSRERTLTSRSLSEAMSGDALFRSGKFSTVFYNKMLSSSLTSSLTTGSELAFSAGEHYDIIDPEGTGSTSRLTGGAAFTRVVSSGVTGRDAATDFMSKAFGSITVDTSLASSYPNTNSGSRSSNNSGGAAGGTTVGSGASGGNDSGSGGNLGTNDSEVSTEGMVSAAAVSGGVRAVAIEEQMSEQEIGWMNERVAVLRLLNVVNDYSYLNNIPFDVPDNLKTIRLTHSYYPGGGNSTLPIDIIQLPQKKVRVCPALIEMLIALGGIIYIKGGVGGGRGLRDGMAVTEGGYLSDHAIGRAFDIGQIGLIDKDPFVISSRDPDVYKQGMEVFLSALNTLPAHLIPDVIIVGQSVASSFGITDNAKLEGEDTIVKQQYPNLKYVNFGFDSSHDNHIHISFTTSRSGIYTGPGGEMNGLLTSIENNSTTVTTVGSTNPGVTSGGGWASTGQSYVDYISNVSLANYIKDIRSQNPFGEKGGSSSGTSTTSGDTTVVGIDIATELTDAKFTKNYSELIDESLSLEDLFALFRLTIATDESAAILAAITKRESNGRPSAITIAKGSDWSIGVLQTSFRPSAHGKKTFYLPSGNVTSVGWQLGYKDYQRDGVTEANFETVAFQKADQFAAELYYSGDEFNNLSEQQKLEMVNTSRRSHACRPLINPACWIPINQAYMIFTSIAGYPYQTSAPKLGSDGTGYMFSPWGDYLANTTGWIRGVSWADVERIYTATGKDISQLKNWLINMYDATGATKYNFPSQKYIQKFTEGWIFPSDGSEPTPPSS